MIRIKTASLLDVRPVILGLTLIISTPIFSQDGSNIQYVKPEYLDNSDIGKLCHIDFGSRSRSFIIGNRVIDTIRINVKGKIISFIEHREDNGYNNWFQRQYLVALPLKKNYSVLLTSSRIDSLNSEKIYVTSFLSYYRFNSPIDTTTQIHHTYLRKNIAEVLFRAKR